MCFVNYIYVRRIVFGDPIKTPSIIVWLSRQRSRYTCNVESLKVILGIYYRQTVSHKYNSSNFLLRQLRLERNIGRKKNNLFNKNEGSKNSTHDPGTGGQLPDEHGPVLRSAQYALRMRSISAAQGSISSESREPVPPEVSHIEFALLRERSGRLLFLSHYSTRAFRWVRTGRALVLLVLCSAISSN